MAKIMDVSEKCLFHQAWDLTSRSRVARLIAMGHAAALRGVRDAIDRRLAAIERAQSRSSGEAVKVPVTGESPSHD
jgi:hypothetical protein